MNRAIQLGAAGAMSVCLAPLLASLLLAGGALAADWPQFRGPASNSAAGESEGPATWDLEQMVAWKVELPGRGPSSPIVVGNRVLLTASSGAQQDRLHVLCFDAASGERLWERQFWATGRTITHPQSANAAPTPASNGKAVFAFFSSNDLVALDLAGDLLWYRGLGRDYPRIGNDAGMASSPLVVDDLVIVQTESQGGAFATGIDARDGSTRWRDRARQDFQLDFAGVVWRSRGRRAGRARAIDQSAGLPGAGQRQAALDVYGQLRRNFVGSLRRRVGVCAVAGNHGPAPRPASPSRRSSGNRISFSPARPARSWPTGNST